MKILSYCLVIMIVSSVTVCAQTLSYQGIARNAQGEPLTQRAIAVRLTIKDAVSVDNTLYSETKSVTPNGFGLYTITINDGEGTRTGNFAAIDWSRQRFIQTEIDPDNGTVFTDLGTAPLHSVPQALNAVQAATLKGIPEPKEGYFIEFKEGRWVQKPKPKGVYLRGSGLNPTTSATLKFIGMTYEFTVEEDNPILTMSLTKALGSMESSSNTNGTNGGLALIVGLGYQKVGQPEVSYFPQHGDVGMHNIQVAKNTRIPVTLSGRFETEFKAGERYIVGMTGHSYTSGNTWNNNGAAMGYIEISY